MWVLFFGDVVGKPGRKAVQEFLSRIGRFRDVDLVVANAENAAGGSGITEEIGKDAGSDQARGKATYPAVIGLTAAKEAARTMMDEAMQAHDRALALDPRLVEALIGRGVIEYRRGAHAVALQDFERALEIEADVILKATNVDGIFTGDPRKDKSAKRYDTLTYMDVLSRDLQVMDASAISLARENKIPIIVFDIHKSGAFAETMRGQGTFTIIKDEART